MVHDVLPAISSGLSLLFAAAVFWQYLRRRKPYQFLWALGLLMYSISTGCEFFMEHNGIEPVAYRMWYLFGAVLVAAYLGMGTIYLLASRRVARLIMIFLAVASVYAAVRVFTGPLDFSQLSVADLEISGKAFPAAVRLMTPLFNLFGTVALVGGALYSAWVFWRQRIMPHRMVANILIAVGALLPAAGGALNRMSGADLLYVLELLGLLFILAGFVLSSRVPSLVRRPGVSMSPSQPQLSTQVEPEAALTEPANEQHGRL